MWITTGTCWLWINFCAAYRNFSRANWRKRNKARALSKGEAVTASCWRWRNAVISIIPHFSLPPSLSPPACRFVLSKLLAAMLKSVPSPFSLLQPLLFSPFFYSKPIARWLYQALCGFLDVFRVFANCYWFKKRKKKELRAGLHLSSRGCTRTIRQNKADWRGQRKVNREKERKEVRVRTNKWPDYNVYVSNLNFCNLVSGSRMAWCSAAWCSTRRSTAPFAAQKHP